MLEKMNPIDFDRVYQILEQSFPVDERRPYEAQRALLAEPRYSILVKREGEAILGFFATWELDGVLFLEHFAVDPAARNGGVGSQMLTELLAHATKPVCLEVEPPADELTRRRVAFYERHGMVLNSYPYTQPAMAEGQSPVPLLIMTSGEAVSKARFEELRLLLYRYVYHVL